MPQKISPDIIRVCPGCGKEFHPTARKQVYCGQDVIKICNVCGKPFVNKCTARKSRTQTCSRECANVLAEQTRVAKYQKELRVCPWCGREFVPNSFKQIYCDDIHYNTCAVCGKEFEVDIRRHDITQTCSDECRYKLATANRDIEAEKIALRETMMRKYGVPNAAVLPAVKAKAKATTMARYGVECYTQTAEYREKSKLTCQEKYGVDHHLLAESVKLKREATCKAKYGAENVFASEYGKYKVKKSMVAKYGVTNPSKSHEFKAKATKAARASNLEKRICQILDNYNIEYTNHYFLKSGDLSHEFDFYIPQYKLLIDADGLYYHGYLDDPDGVRVLDYYDEVRIQLVPDDHIFHVLVESSEDRQIKELFEVLESVNGDLGKYRSYLFDWCRSIEFPYPNYTERRLGKDWKHLKQYYSNEYNSKCRLGESIIKQFHKSIYDCHVGNLLSPREGWYDDDKLMRVIKNRLIYKNDVEPAKILAGFNISKICPCVSMFNPILAKYLIQKYLNEFSTIFDPFSGFSGRLLGAASVDKGYIGQDLNENAVRESNEILDFLKLDKVKYQVSHLDTLSSSGEYECLLTCPPYGTKEHYNQETIYKSCDEWIGECLSRFKCKRYVFVVDTTENYKQNVVETLNSASHLANVQEQVIVIDM